MHGPEIRFPLDLHQIWEIALETKLHHVCCDVPSAGEVQMRGKLEPLSMAAALWHSNVSRCFHLLAGVRPGEGVWLV